MGISCLRACPDHARGPLVTDFVAALIPLTVGAVLGEHVLTPSQVAAIRRVLNRNKETHR